jgi:hypothetical protein
MPLRTVIVLMTAVAVALVSAAPSYAVPLCFDRIPTIVGTAGNDWIAGTPARDIILAGPGQRHHLGRSG